MAEEVTLGAMEAAVPVTNFHEVDNCVGSRRFMVEQSKVKQGQQVLAYRQIDHLTKSLINPAPQIYETLEHDNLDLFSTSSRYCSHTA